jgi:integrase
LPASLAGGAGARPDHPIRGRREVDLGESCIRLPDQRCKNDNAHIVPLSPPARALLEAIPRVGEFVFGAAGPFTSFSYNKAAVDKRIAADRKAAGREPMPPWVIHDLRRSVATHMAEQCGIAPHIIEAVLNHTGGHKAGVAGVYNRATYEGEKRQALDRWTEFLLARVEDRPSTVVPMRAKGTRI